MSFLTSHCQGGPSDFCSRMSEMLQMDKAKAQHARWQSLGKTNPDKKRLESEIEDECKSIAWQVCIQFAASFAQQALHNSAGCCSGACWTASVSGRICQP